jgi:hypothetical protein
VLDEELREVLAELEAVAVVVAVEGVVDRVLGPTSPNWRSRSTRTTRLWVWRAR